MLRIVSMRLEAAREPGQGHHVVAVGIGHDGRPASKIMSLDDVLDAMARGNVFYTRDEATDRVRLVEPYLCACCQRLHIRCVPQPGRMKDLEDLPPARWLSHHGL